MTVNKKNTNPLSVTHPELVKEWDSEKNCPLTPDEVTAGSGRKVWWKCSEGHGWNTTVRVRTTGHGCPKCSFIKHCNDLRKTHEQFVKELHDVNPKVEVLGKYVNSKTKIEVRCKTCGHIWAPVPLSLLRKQGCPQCAQKSRILKRTKTKEQFISELQSSNPDIEVLGEYLGSRERIQVRCKKCNHIWNPQASSVLHSCGCPQCAGVAKKTHSDFVEEMKQINPDILIMDQYTGMHSHIRVKCKICGYVWDAPPVAIYYNGSGCPRCCHTGTSFFEQLIYLVFQKLCSQEVFSRDRTVLGMELDIYIPSIKVAVEYGSWFWHKNRIETDKKKASICREKSINLIEIIDSCKGEKTGFESFPEFWLYDEDISSSKNEKTQIQVLHDICNTIGIPYTLSQSDLTQLRSIARKSTRMRTTEQLAEELHRMGSRITLVGEYEDSHSKIEAECQDCGHRWYPIVSNLLKGYGCPKCSNRIKVTTDEFKTKMALKNPNIVVLGEYINSREPIKVKCKTCNHEWNSSPSNLTQGKGCPKCKGGIRLSNEEFLERMKSINPDIEIHGDYFNRRSKISVKCRKCGQEWSALASSLLAGKKCLCSRPPRGHNFKKVICIETGKVYDSISSAQRETGIRHIISCVTGNRKKAGGYHWKYYDERVCKNP